MQLCSIPELHFGFSFTKTLVLFLIYSLLFKQVYTLMDWFKIGMT